MPPSKKMGRPRSRNNTFYDAQGNELVGFNYDASADTYCYRWKAQNGKWQKRNLSRDEKRARYKYYRVKAEVNGENFSTVRKPDYIKSLAAKAEIVLSDKIFNLLENNNIDPVDFLKNVIQSVNLYQIDIQDSYVWERVKELIQEDPKKASNILDIPYENLIGVKTRKIYTLKEIGDNYFNQEKFQHIKKRSQINEIREVKRSWKKFVQVLGVETITEVTKKHINEYFVVIQKEAMENDLSSSMVRKYFEHPRRILNQAITDFEDTQDIIEVKNKCLGKLKPPPKVIKYPPKKISREDFGKILDASDVEEKAMWLLSLNGAYYAIDLTTLPLNKIDWIEKTIVFRRGKTEGKGHGHRSCFLWNRTIEAIHQFQKEKPHNGETLFYNNKMKKPYNRDWITEKFRNCLKNAGLKGKYTHQNFRDSVKTIGHAAGPSIRYSVDAIMGHKPEGVSRDYVDPEEYPKIAEFICLEIEKEYFG